MLRGEPVAWMIDWPDEPELGHYFGEEPNPSGRSIPLYTTPAQQAAPLTDDARDVLAERRRQVEVEGWTPAHDDEHSNGEMAVAAAAYASESRTSHGGMPGFWPWAREWWKPGTARRMLVKAGALILAEIERIDRAALQSHSEREA